MSEKGSEAMELKRPGRRRVERALKGSARGQNVRGGTVEFVRYQTVRLCGELGSGRLQ